jgi:hypothetical protein
VAEENIIRAIPQSAADRHAVWQANRARLVRTQRINPLNTTRTWLTSGILGGNHPSEPISYRCMSSRTVRAVPGIDPKLSGKNLQLFLLEKFRAALLLWRRSLLDQGEGARG